VVVAARSTWARVETAARCALPAEGHNPRPMARPGSRARRSLAVLHLTHPDLLPPADGARLSPQRRQSIKTDVHVVAALRSLGHRVRSVGVDDRLEPLRLVLDEFRPQVVFNLLEGFAGRPELDAHVVSHLELLGLPYTGCHPRGLVLARDKALAKILLQQAGLRTPAFQVFRPRQRIRRPAHLQWPLLVKSRVEESSIGIAQASLVRSEAALEARVRFIHECVDSDALVEEYIEGRELSQGVLGHRRPAVFPAWELRFGALPAGAARIATARVKHDPAHQRRNGITTGRARGLSPGQRAQIERTSRRVYEVLGLSGYARIDYRLARDGTLHVLEANPNPDIASTEEFAEGAAAHGLSYEALIQRVLELALARRH